MNWQEAESLAFPLQFALTKAGIAGTSGHILTETTVQITTFTYHFI